MEDDQNMDVGAEMDEEEPHIEKRLLCPPSNETGYNPAEGAAPC